MSWRGWVPTMSDIDEAIDWLGKTVSCESCAHQALLDDGRCRPKHACIHDRYARRIGRFLNWNPALANDYLGHPHFEVRAIAAKFADVFRLPALLIDPEETVRWNAVLRLPYRYLLRLRDDPHREVRIRVAARLLPSDLVTMMHDSDYYVRLVVARRIEPTLLPRLIDDPEVQVRVMLAQRIDESFLLRLASDRDPAVRLEAVRRLPVGLLALRRDEPHWRVRYEIASRIDIDLLGRFDEDPDPMVREVAASRRDGTGLDDTPKEGVR
jgi:hypothetical protein